MIPFFKILHIDENGIETNLNSFISDFQTSQVSEAKKNNLNLNLKNPNNKLNNINFKRDDSTIKVYLDWEPIVSQDPLIVSNIDTINWNTNDKGQNSIKIKSLDKTGLFLSKLWSFAYSDQTPNPYVGGVGLKADEGIRHVVESSQDNLPESEWITFNNVVSTKSDGTAFTKDVNTAKTWKPLYEWLNEFSTAESTEDNRTYVYYLDENRDLHWHYPWQKQTTNLTSTIDSLVTTIPVISTSSYADSGVILIEDEQITYTAKTSTSFTGASRGANGSSADSHVSGEEVTGQKIQTGVGGVYSMKINTDGDGEYNMIIYNAGKVPENYEYLWYEIDESELGGNLKMKFYDWKDISLSTFNTEKVWTDPVTGFVWTDNDSNYPKPNGSALSGGNPWHPSWKSSLVITSDDDYQSEFITHILNKGRQKALAFFRTGREKFKAEVNFKGTTYYKVNDLITLFQVRQGITKRLRVKEVRHNVIGGWTTNILLETDEAVSAS